MKSNPKKAGKPTLGTSYSDMLSMVMTIMTGSVIKSAVIAGQVSAVQSVLVTQMGQKLSHHVYTKQRGWVKQAAKNKPMVLVQAKVDLPAYIALQIPTPRVPVRVSEGYHLADTGASICLGGKQFMRSLGLNEDNLTPCDMSVCGADNANIRVLGAVLVEFAGKNTQLKSKQVVYICDGVAGALLSLEACIDLGLVDENFPKLEATEGCSAAQQAKKEGCECACPVRTVAPDPPETIPGELTALSVPKLEAWIREYYSASAFNCCECQALPKMQGPPLKIYMQEGVKPVASHSPIPVPLHWHKKVKAGLDRDEAIGVIERVPPGTPTTWCHRMVVVPKKDNSPRRTVNFQPLNQFSSRQTHHTMSPFHQATSIPGGTKKTVLDAWNGYHSVALDPSCKDLTTFITPWGRYRYRTAPQGYLAAGDAYTERFDRIISEVPNKTKCVDDTVLWSSTVEESFFTTCKFLTLCSRNGIVFNREKFQFCRDEVEFAGFLIGKDYVKPAPKILDSIREFPVPKNLADIRGWFGLVNQVAPFFASRPVMQPFRELLKPSAKGKQIYWDENLTALFEESKVIIVQAIQEGIKTFKMGRWTCLMPDFCKTGIGYLLMQKKCTCDQITPYCCSGGWQVVLAGSRFTKDAETRYAPVEGEALACEWALESTRHYTLGNTKLLIATDHKPLLKILGDRKLEDIDNPRLAKLKEKMLRWKFDIIHVPGKIHVGPDTLSRQEVTVALVNMFAPAPAASECWDSTEDLEAGLEAVVAANIPHPISWQEVREAVACDKVMTMLADQISDGFPPDKKLLRLELREYYQHREDLTQVDRVPLYKGRVIVPVSLRSAVLETLHSAHQGVTGMTLRAQGSVWWPGITPQIKETRDKCKNCIEHAPSQPSAPPLPLPQPDYPFQCLASDYFQESGHHYLVIADRFSGWPTVQFCGRSTASAGKLIECLREYFAMHGIPEEISTDGGSTYMAYETQKFLSDYGVRHRVSSVAYPHSNQRAELAVKSMKRLCRENTNRDGSLNSDKFLRAVMSYRNTPDRDTERSPAQVIFGRNLRDFLPAPMRRLQPQPQWLLLRDDRERALRKRALQNTEKLSVGTKQLRQLKVQDTVQVQNQVGNHPSRWDITGVIVETRPFDQYVIKIHGSGRLTTRNRKFLRQITPYCPAPKPSAPIAASPDTVTAKSPTIDIDVIPVVEDPPHEVIQDLEGVIDLGTAELGVGQGTPELVENQTGLRRSSRTSKAPVRLQVESWKGQSYDPGPSSMSEREDTASQSVACGDYLHPVRPDGGEGFHDDGVHGCRLYSSVVATTPGYKQVCAASSRTTPAPLVADDRSWASQHQGLGGLANL